MTITIKLILKEKHNFIKLYYIFIRIYTRKFLKIRVFSLEEEI